MPLEIIPFETPALTRGRLRLNAGLEHVVDVYSDDRGQHGYIQLNQVTQKDGAQNYGWSPDLDLHPDMAILGKLRNLASFDVFSLRILFRANGIAPKDSNALELSATTKASLSAHLKRFTPPWFSTCTAMSRRSGHRPTRQNCSATPIEIRQLEIYSIWRIASAFWQRTYPISWMRSRNAICRFPISRDICTRSTRRLPPWSKKPASSRNTEASRTSPRSRKNAHMWRKNWIA